MQPTKKSFREHAAIEKMKTELEKQRRESMDKFWRNLLIFIVGALLLLAILFIAGNAQAEDYPPNVVWEESRLYNTMSAHAQFATKEIIYLINVARTQRSLRPVQMETNLNYACFFHSMSMAEHDFFTHVDREGRTAKNRINLQTAPYTYGFDYVGENLAKFGWTISHLPPTKEGRERQIRKVIKKICLDMVAGWIKSPTHAKVLFEKKAMHVGSGPWLELEHLEANEIRIHMWSTVVLCY